MARPFVSFRSTHRPIRARDVADCVEALAYLTLSRVAIGVLPFSTAMRWMEAARPSGQPDDMAVERSLVAIGRVERRIFWKTRCLDRGMALHRMLRRRGVASQLVYGLASSPAKLAAHVWVEVGGATVMGGDEAPDFCEVARFPRSPDRLS